MTDIGQKIWHFCHTLRDEGMSYGNYIEQLTYLLFLKMAAEKDADIPKGCTWNDLIKESGEDLMKKYEEILDKLSKHDGVLGDIFASAKNLFRKPVGLKKIIDMIDGIDWGAIPVDQLGTIYEDLLQRYAEEKKGGAGQYFTPRPVIKAIVEVMKPTKEMVIHDPACGTGGFLVAAYEYILDQLGGRIDPDDEDKLKYSTFTGQELVLETRRLCIMNLYLHGIHDGIRYGDSLSEQREAEWEMVLTNPPFGTKSGGETPSRSDFNVGTANKQLNFVQHVMSGLKQNGKAAMVLPDNVLFEEGAGKELRKILLRGDNLHTILKLPTGIFYKPGVKANVLFFEKGTATKSVWVYDLRTNKNFTLKENTLKDSDFDDFVKLYNSRKETERSKLYSIKEIEEKEKFNLDLKWIKDENFINNFESPNKIVEQINQSENISLKEMMNISDTVSKMEKIQKEDKILWEPIKLDEVAEVIFGQSPPGESYNKNNKGVPLLNGAADFGEIYPKPKKYTTNPLRISRKGDTLICIRATIGDVNISDKEYALGRGVAAIRPKNDSLLDKFLMYWTLTIGTDLKEKSKGTAIVGIKKRDLADLKIMIPCPHNKKESIEIQKMMVDNLEEFFKSYKNKLDHQATIDKKIELLPKSVLFKAFRGKL